MNWIAEKYISPHFLRSKGKKIRCHCLCYSPPSTASISQVPYTIHSCSPHGNHRIGQLCGRIHGTAKYSLCKFNHRSCLGIHHSTPDDTTRTLREKPCVAMSLMPNAFPYPRKRLTCMPYELRTSHTSSSLDRRGYSMSPTPPNPFSAHQLRSMIWSRISVSYETTKALDSLMALWQPWISVLKTY